MKLSKIKRAIAQRKTWSVVTLEDGAQWIGDGAAFYAVPQSIDMTEANATTILDINADKRIEYSVREIINPDRWWDMLPREGDEAEMLIQAQVVYGGKIVYILTTRDNECAMIDAGYASPAEDAENGILFTLRRRYDVDGKAMEPVVMIYDDMLACAMIMPLRREGADAIWGDLRRACAPELKYVTGGAANG